MAQNINVKENKKRLIIERIDSDPMAKRGMKVARNTLLILLLLRGLLFLYELIYYNMAGLDVGIVSNLLLIPMLFIIYMVYDGNREISGVLMIAAVVRTINLFSTVYPTLPTDAGATVYTGVYLFIMAYQFAVTLLVTAYAPAVAYFAKMQAINMELGSQLRSGSSTGANRRK